MPTSTSLNLQALLKTAAARTGMDSPASHVRGLSASALEGAVKPFPSLQIDPYRDIAPHFGVASARAAALHAIATGTAKVVVASAGALLSRLSAPGNLESAAI